MIGTFDCCGPVYADQLVDVRKHSSRFVVSVEDPVFEGTQCPWHYLIEGHNGSISPSGPGTLYVSYGTDGTPEDHSFPESELQTYLHRIRAKRR